MKIICKSALSESLVMEFKNNKQRNNYIYSFCSCGCWKGCTTVHINQKKEGENRNPCNDKKLHSNFPTVNNTKYY